jgi:hypothetical protein
MPFVACVRLGADLILSLSDLEAELILLGSRLHVRFMRHVHALHSTSLICCHTNGVQVSPQTVP